MRTVFGCGLLVLALWCLCAVAGAHLHEINSTTSSNSNNNNNDKTGGSTSPTAYSHSSSDTRHTTCQSGTVNYITHSLPQQCLSRNNTTTSPTSISITTPSDSISTSTLESTTTTTSIVATSATPSSEPVPSATQLSEPESESDSPLDNSNFLSFEEWKKQNLAKVGQSPEHVGQQSRDKAPRNMPQINNALDVLGEDSEIELDFSGFGRKQDSPESSNTDAQAPISTGRTLRSRDAGKTCKERSNYASFDCAATVLKSNPESKSASAVLIENKDSYMLNICSSSNKFLILELCDDILIDTIVLANYEFFSSIFRTFRVSVSDRYPVKHDRWRDLGVFEARNTRSVQAFLVEQPLIWARYLRLEFLTHYGNEYYCPVSLIRVHGTTMMEEFRHQEELSRGEVSDDLEESVMPDASESLSQEPAQSSKEADKSIIAESIAPVKPSSQTTSEAPIPSSPTSHPASARSDETSTHTDPGTSTMLNASSTTVESSSTSPGTVSSIVQAVSSAVAPSTSNLTHATNNATTHHSPNANLPSSEAISSSNSSVISTTVPKASSSSSVASSQKNVTEPTSVENVSSSTSSPSKTDTKAASSESTSQSTANTTTPKIASSSIKASSAIPESQQKSGTSTISSAHSNPTTQESFFKSIHKRLQMLESNATLSLQYIEEQSRILRDAFIKVEKRQIKKTESFLENLNTTVFAELQDFKQQYDQLWQSTVIELENHREQYQREILAVSARLSIVADELVFQKRMAIVQSTLLMLCLGLVLFVRAGSGAGLDIPIIQQMVNKSQLGRRSSYYSPLNSPSPDQTSPPDGPRDFRRRKTFWRSSQDTIVSTRPTSRGNGDFSEASIEEHPRHGNPDLRFEPPTPTYNRRNAGDSEIEGEDGILVSPTTSSMHEGSPVEVVDQSIESEDDLSLPPQETQSSPSTPSGSRDQQTSLKMLPAWPSSPRASDDSNDDPTSAAKRPKRDNADPTPQSDETSAPV